MPGSLILSPEQLESDERAIPRNSSVISEEGSRFLFENTNTPMWICDRKSNRIVAVNKAGLERTGYTREEFLGLGPQEALVDSSSLDSASASQGRWLLRHKGGEMIQVQVKTHDLLWEGVQCSVFAVKDIHPAESRLLALSNLGYRLCSARTQRQAIEIILDTADSFFGWDACTFDSYLPAEDYAEAVIVIDRVDGVRRNVEPSSKSHKPTTRMRQVIEEGPLLILRKPPLQMAPDSVPIGDRNRPSASLLYVPIRSGEKVIGVLSIQSYSLNAYTHADLDLLQALADHGAGALERIQAEEKIKAINSQLEDRIAERTAALQATVGELEAFSYSVSHDMRAPLRAMQGYAQKLIDDYLGKTLDDQASEYLSRISRAAIRMDTLIQDVLTYTKVLREKVPMGTVNLEGLIKDMLEAYPQWRQPKVQISIASPLPPVVGNEALLTQCISNILSNSVKFVSPGTIPEVRIWAESSGDNLRLCFQDNGIGIAAENHWRIFRMFERINPASQFEGTGIGLTIVRKAVERMNGSCGFESEFGKGSTFWIELKRDA